MSKGTTNVLIENIEVEDLSKSRRIGVDESFIRFRPSSNFRNMKKFMISKINNTEQSPTTMDQTPTSSLDSLQSQDSINSVTQSPNASTPTRTPNQLSTLNTENSLPKQNIEQKSIVKPVEGQPPLPLDPPPPYNVPNLNIQLKQEIEDNEFDDSNTRDESEPLTEKSEELITKFKVDQSDDTVEKQKFPICRDFIRGTCCRVGTCKYAHEYDTSQLVGVYTFCRNFQNSVCTYPNCRYVHATVFEEQKFYRTGTLPPHALNHNKKPDALQPPPPPPPPPEESAASEIPPNFSTAPPVLQSSVNTMPVMNCMPPINMDTTPVNTSPQSVELKDPKNCNNCRNKEYRVLNNKEKVDESFRANEVRNNKITRLAVKNQKLYSLIVVLLKPSYNNKATLLSSLLPVMAHGSTPPPDKDKNALEELQSMLSKRILTANEENKNVMPHDLASLMAKLLQQVSGEHSSESSHDT